MELLSYWFFWGGLGATGVASTLYALRLAGRRMLVAQAATDAGSLPLLMTGPLPGWWSGAATAASWVALSSLTASLAARWVAAQRPPLSNMWEYSVAFAWGIVLTYVVVERRYRQRSLGALVMPVALGLLAVAAAFFPWRISPLLPALQANRILGAHVATMMLAYSALTVSFATAILSLIQGDARRFQRLPARALLEEIGDWSVMVGFPLLTLGIALGAWWGNSAWGRYWGWDPKETSSLVSFLIYAGYLHMRHLRGWRGNRAAWALVLGYVSILFSYFAVNLWVAGLHSYAGV